MVALTALDGWLIAAALIGAYGVVLALLHRAGRLGPDRALSLFGPALMMKTQRGRGLLDRLGRYRRFWSVASAIGVGLAAAAMALVVGVLAVDAVIVAQTPSVSTATPSEALALPGLNPIIPIGYGIVALVVGIVLHELAHGVVARAEGIRVKSLGILWFVVPIGAFVEQDDDDITNAPRRRRRRVAAAGILANFVLAVIFFAVAAALVSTSIAPNATGAGVAGVVAGSPAANVSLVPGDIITAVNGTPTPTNDALLSTLAATRAGEVTTLSYVAPSGGPARTVSVTLASRASYTHVASDAGKGFLGVSTDFLTPAQLKSVLVFPPTSPDGALAGSTEWLVLPLAGLSPVAGTTAAYFHGTGLFAGADLGGLWIVVNIFYWLSWMNLLLGLSNALPLVPLDGGLLFRDFVGGVASRLRPMWAPERLNRFTGSLTAVASVTVVFLLVWQFVAPAL
ncbi:MAG TPA: site-2 protease family protein [Thermoplasmata archaeon]|nr:site-2 protease family protein [Thermoplasmata archaeon]